jgi:NAD(P)-dependent dehydrogenase (short-subunit alcohol dehydrogenase family)
MSGVSSGFGKLTVPLLLEKGHTVVAGLRGGQSRLESLFPEELKKFPNLLHAVELNLEKSAELTQAAALIQKRFGGKLDVLINNAGYGLLGVLEDQSDEQIRYQMEINFTGTALLTRAMLPALRAAKGRILNVSSIAGRTGFPFYGSYCASKYALEGLMECLYYDLRPFQVQIGMIEPGGFKTSFTQAKQFGVSSDNPSSPYYERTQGFKKVFDKTSGRLDDPMKVARLISRLCDARRIPFRNRIGRDAFSLQLLEWIVPERMRLPLVHFIFNSMLKNTQSRH